LSAADAASQSRSPIAIFLHSDAPRSHSLVLNANGEAENLKRRT
jgi:hypothetical protein